ncbi:TniB family NTP-binding protein [Burkholderia ubonensis]|uniref:TniB family NTP-binding protein n=1 Tax=Burkholderia ubonensis TaxID=101571 RepID=UPI0009B41338|nr:TniB family NTP-binding protein [Burkholderia ubonensis]
MRTFAPNSLEAGHMSAFREHTVRHLKVDEALNALQQVGSPAHSDSIIALVGPTGVGKSLLVNRFIRQVNESYAAEMQTDFSMVPAIVVELPTPIAGDFNWKDAGIRIISAFDEPLIAKKVLSRLQAEVDGELIANPSRLVAEELRRAVKSCVRNRKTKIIALDEASNLFRARSASRHSLQLDLVQSLVNDIKIPLILASTYDLLRRENFHGQLMRRTEVVHFGRYLPEELAPGNPYGDSFRNTVYTLLNGLPVPWDERLLEHPDYFLMSCIGCVGILKKWLMLALEKALILRKPIDADLLQKAAYENYKLLTMLEEARAGERLLADVGAEELARRLGFSQVPSPILQTNRVPHKPEKGSRGRRKPGTRNPSRDKVGDCQ